MHKKVSYGGMATALAVILLALSAYFPTGKAATLFASSALVYAATSILAFLITSGTFSLITASFIICFGNYPVIRYFTENKNVVLMIITRSVLYSIYFVIVYGVANYFMPSALPLPGLVLYIAGAVAFIGYDVLLKYTGIYLEGLFYRIKR